MMASIRNATIAMVLAGVCTAALCDETAPQSRPADGIIKVGVATRYHFGWWGVGSFADDARQYKWFPWAVGFQFSDQKRPDRLQLDDLMAGKYDLAVVTLPLDTGQEPKATIKSLRDRGCRVAVVAWRVLGVAVHPSCALEAMDQAKLRDLITGRIKNWHPLTGRDAVLKAVADDRVYQTLRGISGTVSPKSELAPRISGVLAKLAEDPQSVGLMAIDERLTCSGLKILPIRTAGGKQPIEPSARNVADGTYPFYTCLAVVTRPGAPIAAKAFAKLLEGERFADKLDTWGSWVTRLDYALPGQEKPAATESRRQAAPPKLTCAVAVLPVENHSPHFLMARQEHLAAWEQAITEGIGADKRMAMVDRTELTRVLDELKRALATGKSPPGPMLSADVLVASSMVTRSARAWLVIQAMHAPTGSCLGEIRLPVDPARPGEFEPALAGQVRQWWPGVLANLVATRTCPIWAVAPAASATTTTQPAGPGLDATRAEIEAMLEADARVFLAQYRMVSQAQREKIMLLMGLARTGGGSATPAADFLVDLSESNSRIMVRILAGRGLKTLVQSELPADRAVNWLRRNLPLHHKPGLAAPTASRAAEDTAAVAQAKMELRRGLELQAKHDKLQGEAFDRYRAKGLSDYSDEDSKQLDELQAAASRCFERAAQLDPASEKASRQLVDAAWRKMGGKHDAMVLALHRCRQYVESFPGSPVLRDMLERVIGLEANLARYLEQTGVRDSKVAAVPRNLPGDKLMKDYRRSALGHMAQYMRLYIAAHPRCGGNSSQSFGVMTDLYYNILDQYMVSGVSRQEMEEVVTEYGQAVDSYPQEMKPSDFVRLQYHAITKDRQAYMDTLAIMQKRWPDPKGPHWNLGKDRALEDLCELLQTDRRATGFYQWLRGKSGPGELP